MNHESCVPAQGILDYMDNLTPQQIRRLFQLLSRLAFGQRQLGTSIQVLTTRYCHSGDARALCFLYVKMTDPVAPPLRTTCTS